VPPFSNRRKSAEYHELRERQLQQETKTIDETCAKYKTLVDTMVKLGKTANLPPGHELLVEWYVPLVEAIDAEQRAVVDDVKFADRQLYGPFLASTSPDKLAVITIHTAINSCTASGDRGASFARLAKDIADAVQTQVNFAGLQDKLGKGIASRLTHAGTLSMRRINQRARASLESTEWEPHIKAKLGAVLISMLLKVAVHQSSSGPIPCFRHQITQLKGNHKQGTIIMEPSVSDQLKSQATTRSFANTNATNRGGAQEASKDTSGSPHSGQFSLEGQPGMVTAWDKREGQDGMEVKDGSRHLGEEANLERSDSAPVLVDNLGMPLMARNLPMLVEPKPWTRFDRGGFLKKRTKVMRIRGSRGQTEALRDAPLERVFEGLNALGKLKWCVNTDVLDVCQAAWDQKLAIGELPSQTNHPIAEFPSEEEKLEDEKAYWQAVYRIKKAKAKNSDLHSLRCDAQIKLGIAQNFRNDNFYFPYNMDFRGRAYPIPPNLNHLGNDMSRGLLAFADKKPLGPRGLFWLKVQVANLCGYDKASFEDRALWTEARMDHIRDSASNPLDGDRWWLDAENPWQALATCMELVRALDSPVPEEFMSGMPVHMDGSCNGLQHYAALGRDFEGGKQVNLVDGEKPRDVYSGVCAIVVDKIAKEAARTPGPDDTELQLRENANAKLIEGMIDRKVVKQTVMTSVYGVTFIGARKQIQNRLEEKLAASGKLSEEEIEKLAYSAASYVASITMDALTELFTGARNIMTWLASCARVVAAKGQPVNWVTPLGLPVSQPYRHGGLVTVRTVLQTVQVVHESDDLNVHVMKQKSAFPPNFVHSLDSTHMLLTSIKMQSRGLSFTAVHDSYWTHPCSVDEMNHELRDCFRDLYSSPILEDLLESFELRYPSCDFPPLPERGELDMEDVTKSTYFFN